MFDRDKLVDRAASEDLKVLRIELLGGGSQNAAWGAGVASRQLLEKRRRRWLHLLLKPEQSDTQILSVHESEDPLLFCGDAKARRDITEECDKSPRELEQHTLAENEVFRRATQLTSSRYTEIRTQRSSHHPPGLKSKTLKSALLQPS